MSDTREITYADMQRLVRQLAERAVEACADIPLPKNKRELGDFIKMQKTAQAMIDQIFGPSSEPEDREHELTPRYLSQLSSCRSSVPRP